MYWILTDHKTGLRFAFPEEAETNVEKLVHHMADVLESEGRGASVSYEEEATDRELLNSIVLLSE